MSHLLSLLLILQAPADSVDVLIRNGTVYDGSGGPARRVDVGIRADRIVFLGDATQARIVSKQTVDATNLIIAPGFIDPHTHSFDGLPNLNEARRKNPGALMQGVTTVVTGADGRGPLDVARVLTEAEKLGLGTNTYALTGFGSARSRVMGNSSAPATPVQIDSMKTLIATAMSQGAFGVGSGLFYAPQSYATTEEVIAVLKGATPYGGVYDTHQRDESSYTIGLLNSVREAIRIGRETGLTTNLGHVKALGVDVWGYADSVLALMSQARAAGHMVVADQYPWTASGTGLGSSLLPRWSQAGGRDSLLQRIADPVTRDRILVEMRDNLRRRGGDSTLLLTGGGAAAQPFKGKTLKQVAAEKGTGAVETALELIRTVGDLSVASFNMNEQDIETFMKDPYVMTSSDGSGGHPRLYGTYPRKIRRYVLDKPVITMERMIRASSSQVAEVYGIPERGRLEVGFFADVIVFDPRTIREEATYVEPEKLSTGMRWVLVSGQAAVADGVPTGVLAGKGLRKAVKQELLLLGATATLAPAQAAGRPERAVAFTFDDLPVSRFTTTADVEAIHARLRAQIHELRIPAIGFVNEIKVGPAEGPVNPLIALLEAWLEAGLELGNHTYSHLRLFDVPLDAYQADVLRGERVTRRLLAARGQRPRYFRHPTLNTGPDLKTKQAFERFLRAHGYEVAPVTIDSDEYLYALAYDRARGRGDSVLMQRLGRDYVRYMDDTFSFYERLSNTMLGREPAQILLLHANALNADYLGRLAAMVAVRGYRFVSLRGALEDPVYTLPDTYIGPRGPSWLVRWASTRGHPSAEPPAVPMWVRDISP